ncbi:MCE family protein [Mycobacterium sp. 1465703.0]|uniref:MCE family protein n=1 Tax=Mycobacterium sp. 1465703.0 TaxID=1834078 RepID=UPI0007FC920C|nr:MCE family protein [Mycobacterium sp. 1465703.0]OBJ08851.1 mammalian cell entry protein [Mycobacterium sp. 1465703.0]
MRKNRFARTALAALLTALAVSGVVTAVRTVDYTHRVQIAGYFDNSNGLFTGDEVRILGIRVGEVSKIEAEAHRVKISFWVDDKYAVPADANAIIIAPSLVTARAIQLTPTYTGGPKIGNHTVIPQTRTAVPVEWDDLRAQLQTLAETLKPTEPGGVSTLGALINSSAENLRGQGANIRDTIIKLSQAFSALGDHSGDIFATVKNLATLVSALRDSTDVLRRLNGNFAAVSAAVANGPDEVSQAVESINLAVGDVTSFVSQHREAIGSAADKFASVIKALNDSRDDVEQLLHAAPTTMSNVANLYQPAQGAVSGTAAIANFSNPIQFICGAIEAASRLNAQRSAKLCVQYLAPIIKNREYNFPPIGFNQIVGATARPNEITYSEDWLRPDHAPPAAPPPPGPGSAPPSPPQHADTAVPADAFGATATNPALGLPGMMLPSGGPS